MEKELQLIFENYEYDSHIPREKLTEIITDALSKAKSIRDMQNLIDEAKEEFRDRDSESEEDREIHYKIDDWVYCHIPELFIKVNGMVHKTMNEAANIAADIWVNLLFKRVIQDNGDKTGHSDMAMMLGSLLKSRAQDNITPEIIEKARQNIYDHYREPMNQYYSMSVDYYPNKYLYDALLDAGVPENDIDSICPWKTSIYIDARDLYVVVCTYQDRKYL